MSSTALPFQLIIFDLDGTLYVDQKAIESAVAVVDQLRQKGYQLRFMTNTTIKTQAALLDSLLGMGFDIRADELISAPEAARIQLRQIQQQRSQKQPIKIWPVVSPNILPDFAEFEMDDNQPDYIVLGDIGDAWNLALVNRLFNAIHQGATLIALHKNKFWQLKQQLHVDIGLFVAGLEYVTGKPAEVMGKPSKEFFQQVLASANCEAEHAFLIGDDIDSDIAGAKVVGMTTALVKTGKYRDAYTQTSAIKPAVILDSVANLAAWLDSKNKGMSN
jgi:HAD superfamily hydrolase (TIGR01458 family)